MPYELAEARGKRQGYYVITKKTGEAHSKNPLPLKKAMAQMRILSDAESKKMRGGATAYQMLFGKQLGYYTQRLKDETDAIILRDMTERHVLGLPNYTHAEGKKIRRFYKNGAEDLRSVGSTNVVNEFAMGDAAFFQLMEQNRLIQRKLDIIQNTNRFLADYLLSIRPMETRKIPRGSTDSITEVEIRNGDIMVDFDNSYSRGTYFLQSTFNALPVPKRNPFNRRLIVGAKEYKAMVDSIYLENPVRSRSRPTVATYIPQRTGRGKKGGRRAENLPNVPPLAPPEPDNLERQLLVQNLMNHIDQLGRGLDQMQNGQINNLAELRAYAQYAATVLIDNHAGVVELMLEVTDYDIDEIEAILTENEAYFDDPEQMTMERIPRLALVVDVLMGAIGRRIEDLGGPGDGLVLPDELDQGQDQNDNNNDDGNGFGDGILVGEGRMRGGGVYDRTFGHLPDYFFEY